MVLERYCVLVPEELIRRALNGDQQAFNDLALAYSKRVRGTIDRITAGSGQTVDISETVFLRLYSSLHQLSSTQSFEPWLYRLTVNAAYDFLRNQRRNR
jgi:RNA polymerase sigma-70 factor (ECF subfamily)